MFDVAEAGYRAWCFVAIGLVLSVVGCGLVLFRHRFRGTKGIAGHPLFPFGYLFFSLLWTVLVFGLTLLDYWTLRAALNGPDLPVRIHYCRRQIARLEIAE